VGEATIGSAPGVTLAGVALTLPGAPALAAGLTGGFTVDYEFLGGATLYGGVDGTVYRDLSYALTGEAGIKGAF
jgi:hypothetical protein